MVLDFVSFFFTDTIKYFQSLNTVTSVNFNIQGTKKFV